MAEAGMYSVEFLERGVNQTYDLVTTDDQDTAYMVAHLWADTDQERTAVVRFGGEEECFIQWRSRTERKEAGTL